RQDDEVARLPGDHAAVDGRAARAPEHVEELAGGDRLQAERLTGGDADEAGQQRRAGGGVGRAERAGKVERDDPGDAGGGGSEGADGDGRDRARPERVDGLVVLEEAGVAGPVLFGQTDRGPHGIRSCRHASLMYLSRTSGKPLFAASRIVTVFPTPSLTPAPAAD